MPRLAYLHGFASGPWSFKGRSLARAFAERGLTLELPDLNRPSFAQLTVSGMLAALDELAAGSEERWSFVGSSLGGWVAARWAELHPERVERLLLLAPAFDLPGRWRDLVSAEQLADWEARGWIATPDGTGAEARLHYEFFRDACRQPPFPAVACPTIILHGREDVVVPLGCSERYVRENPAVRLAVLADGHELLAVLPEVTRQALDWLGATPAAGTVFATGTHGHE